MKVLLETSTLIAAMLPDHPHHAPAIPWLSRAKSGAFEFICSWAQFGRSLRGAHEVAAVPQDRPRRSLAHDSRKHYVPR
jgi:predicted nucleic acid-binding protein